MFTPKLVTVLREGYGFDNLRAGAVAGLTVAIVALPLSMAIAIASGASPAQGLYTAIIGGFVVSALGGSRFQMGRPAGAFIVLVAATVGETGDDDVAVRGDIRRAFGPFRAKLEKRAGSIRVEITNRQPHAITEQGSGQLRTDVAEINEADFHGGMPPSLARRSLRRGAISQIESLQRRREASERSRIVVRWRRQRSVSCRTGA